MLLLFYRKVCFQTKQSIKNFLFADRRKGKIEFDNYKASLKADIGSKLLESAPIETVSQPNSQTNVTIPDPTFDDRISELENKINAKKRTTVF